VNFTIQVEKKEKKEGILIIIKEGKEKRKGRGKKKRRREGRDNRNTLCIVERSSDVLVMFNRRSTPGP